MRSPHRLLSLLTTACLIAACAARDTTGDSASDSAEDLEPIGIAACFYRLQVSDFRALDRSNLIVYAPTRSNAYRVRISPPSSELRYADAIAFRSRNPRICGYAGERIVIEGAGSPREFSIISVYRLDAAGLDALLAQYGKGKGADALEPKETDGAAIERDIDGADQPQTEDAEDVN